MILAGFDVATRTGIAVMDGDRLLQLESFSPGIARPEGMERNATSPVYEAMLAEKFRDHVRAILVAHQVQYIAFEAPRTRDFERKVKHGGGEFWGTEETTRASSNLAMLRGFGLCTQLCGIAHRLNIPAHPVDADTWRQSFLGFSRKPRSVKDGRAYLKAAAKSQCELLGFKVPNDDCADAVGVCWWLAGHLRISKRVRPGELQLGESAA